MAAASYQIPSLVQLSGPKWVDVSVYNTRQGRIRNYTMETKTGDLYWRQTSFELALKCTLIFAGTILYTPASMVWNVARAVALLFIDWSRIPAAFWDVLRAPAFGIAMMLAAATFPFGVQEARQRVAIVEKAWHQDISYREDWRYKDDPSLGDCENCIFGIRNAPVFYLAWCFQKRGNINDGEHRFISKLSS